MKVLVLALLVAFAVPCGSAHARNRHERSAYSASFGERQMSFEPITSRDGALSRKSEVEISAWLLNHESLFGTAGNWGRQDSNARAITVAEENLLATLKPLGEVVYDSPNGVIRHKLLKYSPKDIQLFPNYKDGKLVGLIIYFFDPSSAQEPRRVQIKAKVDVTSVGDGDLRKGTLRLVDVQPN